MASDGRKTVLITGAARRIGRGLALDLARSGWSVAIHYNTSQDEALALADEIRAMDVEAMTVQGDLSAFESQGRIVAQAVAELGQLDCLINNASVFEPDEVGKLTLDSWAQHLDTNLRAPVFLSQAFAAQHNGDEPGNIINVIDQRVWKLNPRFFSYTASKSALWTVTRTLAQALAPRIRVNAIGPGPALPNVRMDDDDFVRQKQATLLQRGTSPQEICDAARFILSAPAMTGQMIVLDGGQHLVWQTPDVVDVNE
jgi:NAD(P)-dependent dehydrogenase (short-subunit alcohol dehydrogenase family)